MTDYEYVTSPDHPNQIGVRRDGLTVWFGWKQIEAGLKKAQAKVEKWRRIAEELGEAQAKKEPKYLTLKMPHPSGADPNPAPPKGEERKNYDL